MGKLGMMGAALLGVARRSPRLRRAIADVEALHGLSVDPLIPQRVLCPECGRALSRHEAWCGWDGVMPLW